MNPAAIVQYLWNYCSVLRDDGMSYGDYADLVARDMVADLESALEQLRLIAEDLGEDVVISESGTVY